MNEQNTKFAGYIFNGSRLLLVRNRGEFLPIIVELEEDYFKKKLVSEVKNKTNLDVKILNEIPFQSTSPTIEENNYGIEFYFIAQALNPKQIFFGGELIDHGWFSLRGLRYYNKDPKKDRIVKSRSSRIGRGYLSNHFKREALKAFEDYEKVK